MRLEAVRSDLVNAADMASFQQAFMVYLATQGYKGSEYILTVDGGGVMVFNIDHDLNDAQVADILNRLRTLKSVVAQSTDSGVEYIFT